jgi:poly-gamma-glutamate synthesis protein (capsule biosynthesis protein)
LFGVSYRVGDRVGFAYDMNSIDLNENLHGIRQGKQHSDFLIASLHAHAPGNWSVEPADFVPTLAHAAIDAGASAFLVQGPHRLRGIEIYKGRPIFYSLANFLWDDKQEPVAADYYEQYGVDPAKATDADLTAMLNAREFNADTWFRSYATTCRIERGQLVEVRLYPLDLGYGMRLTKSGIPRLASGGMARSILQELQRLSKPFGTDISIEGDFGVIRPRASTASSR